MRVVVISVFMLLFAISVSATTLSLDFGMPESPVAEKWTQATITTHYTPQLKYGWVGKPRLEMRDRGYLDPLRRDFVYGRHTAEFRVDLPDGYYRVTVHTGDCIVGDHILNIEANGKKIADRLDPGAGEVIAYTFASEVAGGALALKFSSPINNWVLNGLEISPCDGPLEPTSVVTKLPGPRLPRILPKPHNDRLHLVKQPDYSARSYPSEADMMRILERFPMYSERGWHPDFLGKPEVGYFGDPTHAEMGLRAMGNYIFVTSLLATSPEYDPRPSGVSQDVLLQRARACLEYMTRAHATGDLHCADGCQWGNDWQSAWWTARMAAGARLVWPKLTAREKANVERVIVHEANRHLRRNPPSGVKFDTKSEENAWDSEVLAWAVGMFPEHPNAQAWRTKLIQFCMNTLSTASDKNDSTVVDEKPIKEWVNTVNIYDDFTIENHGAYHFCYMACPLHSFAWAFEGLVGGGITPPEAMFHHYQDVWKWIKRAYIGDGRFAYLSGKDWPRYAYGLSFVLPVTVLAQLRYNDPHGRLMEQERIATLEREQLINCDGSFYGGRFTCNDLHDRLAEYETDTYANLGLCYLLHKHGSIPNPPSSQQVWHHLSGSWASSDTEWIFGRSAKTFASFSWRHLHGLHPLGLFIPEGCADMVEWMTEQYIGRIRAENVDFKQSYSKHKETIFDGGFCTTGEISYNDAAGEPVAKKQISFTSLTDEGVAVIFERTFASAPFKCNSSYSLNMAIANDIFNNSQRTIYLKDASPIRLPGAKNLDPVSAAEPNANEVSSTSQKVQSPWVNIDDKLGIVLLTTDDFALYDYSGRNAPTRSLQFDVLLADYEGARKIKTGETITEIAYLLLAGNRDLTAAAYREAKVLKTTDGRSYVLITTPSGKRYIILPNLDGSSWNERIPGTAIDAKFSGFDTQVHLAP
ncbi:MAG: hypothetical protein ACOX3G_10035 [Armatimonadota bacterium]|jgi:hypothetical protein